MSSRAPFSAAHEDGGTRHTVHGGTRTRSGQRGRASRQRAASHRSSMVLHHLREQVNIGLDHGEVRQRYEVFRNSANPGLTNSFNNLGEEELRDQLDEFQGVYSSRSEELRQSHQLAAMDRYKMWHVPRIGNLPTPRPHGTFRWMYCQVNGLASTKSRTAKVHDTWALAEQYDVDGIALAEVGVNWKRFKTSGRLASWFEPLAERQVGSTESFNIHGPAVSNWQQGGTALLLRHGLLEYSRGTAHDSRSLGRWASWVFQTNQDHCTRVIVAYCPGSK